MTSPSCKRQRAVITDSGIRQSSYIAKAISASVSESHPHDIQITKEVLNYSTSLSFED